LIPAVRKAIVPKDFPRPHGFMLHNIGTASLLTFSRRPSRIPMSMRRSDQGSDGKGDRVERKYEDSSAFIIFVFKRSPILRGRITISSKSGVLKNDAHAQQLQSRHPRTLPAHPDRPGKQLTEVGELHAETSAPSPN